MNDRLSVYADWLEDSGNSTDLLRLMNAITPVGAELLTMIDAVSLYPRRDGLVMIGDSVCLVDGDYYVVYGAGAYADQEGNGCSGLQIDEHGHITADNLQSVLCVSESGDVQHGNASAIDWLLISLITSGNGVCNLSLMQHGVPITVDGRFVELQGPLHAQLGS